jgi:[NiFe] hydrogenase large subunit
MSRIVIDPVTRIEGHLKIEVELDGDTVVDAWSSGTLFRGIELILKGRQPQDASLLTQRLCGVCTYVHAVASIRCVEDSGKIAVPANARILRNLMMGAQYVHDHPIHFYHLHGTDWVDVTSALTADPAATATLAKQVSANAPTIDFAAAQTTLVNATKNGQLGPFGGTYGGHPAYRLSPEENLLLVAHYLLAIRQQTKAARLHALFGAKNPHPQTLIAGGLTCKNELTAARITEFRTLLGEMRSFIDNVYLPDVALAASKYKPYGAIGGFGNYLTYGDFPQTDVEPDSYLFPRGYVYGRDLGNVRDVNPGYIYEHVQHSWYDGATPDHPATGKTAPKLTAYDTGDRYSWLKAPRYGGEPMEVGPLARVLIAYAKGVAAVKTAVDGLLEKTGLGLADLHSTLGRVAARAIETKVIADAMDGWLGQLQTGQPTSVTGTIPAKGMGMGLSEAPRGALGHWIDMVDGKINNYQMVVPSTWNLGPRCAAGKRGPVEEALVGTKVADPARPIEILRVVHSYDPCLACAVHVIDGRRARGPCAATASCKD